MRIVVQRVRRACVRVDGQTASAIGQGLLVYVAIGQEDEAPDLEYGVEKVRHLRVFTDKAGKMNLDVVEVGGQVLAVSAFTVYADARKGRRPSFDAAAPIDRARQLFEDFCHMLSETGVTVYRGIFRAKMEVDAVNDGPICVLLDSQRRF
ncbi:MAG TPA: D-aminoacyl-tRNA deacylase [Phycisphaerae bacterium]|nr:D-aminoacyl-tRNA deacylase [Phycisphaerae bacterium]